MSQALDRVGTFRGRIVEYGLHESENTQSVGINIRVAVDEAWNAESQGWEDWRQFDLECYGYLNLIKKDGAANDKSVENIVKCTGWNGSFADVAIGEWKPEPIQFTTKEEVYEGNTSYKVQFVNAYDSTPGGGGMKKLDADKAKALQAKYGTSFKALAANAKRNVPPAGKPSSPPPSSKAEPVKSGNGKSTDGDTPF